MAGKLIICPTPIGNLGDMTERALEALRSADAVCAEDAAAEQDAEAAARDRAVELKAAGARNKDIARAIAEEFGIARNAAYDISLEA